jgi:hypothetical protein
MDELYDDLAAELDSLHVVRGLMWLGQEGLYMLSMIYRFVSSIWHKVISCQMVRIVASL